MLYLEKPISTLDVDIFKLINNMYNKPSQKHYILSYLLDFEIKYYMKIIIIGYSLNK